MKKYIKWLWIIPVSLLCFYLISTGVYAASTMRRYKISEEVSLRKFPYPYDAALSISSDIDNTETVDELIQIQKFLHTTEDTVLGPGLGMDIGNSFFMYEPKDAAISFLNGDTEIRKAILEEIRAGRIDFMHSFGKKAGFSREDAIESIETLINYDIDMDVWVDHTISDDNLGDDVTNGFGDIPGHHAYHFDLLHEYGFRYFWVGRITSVIGQDIPVTPLRFTEIIDSDYPSTRTVAVKEWIKQVLGVFGIKKYRMHRHNNLVEVKTFDDGQKGFEFIRYDASPKGPAYGADSKGLAYSIRPEALDQLVSNNGYMVVYTHLGKNYGSSQYLPPESIDSLRNLKRMADEGKIYVTTTTSLLHYNTNFRYLDWDYTVEGNTVSIRINSINCPVRGSFVPERSDITGFTFYVPEEHEIQIYIQNRELTEIVQNPTDGHSVSVSVWSSDNR